MDRTVVGVFKAQSIEGWSFLLFPILIQLFLYLPCVEQSITIVRKIYMYIQKERERERERNRLPFNSTPSFFSLISYVRRCMYGTIERNGSNRTYERWIVRFPPCFFDVDEIPVPPLLSPMNKKKTSRKKRERKKIDNLSPRFSFSPTISQNRIVCSIAIAS